MSAAYRVRTDGQTDGRPAHIMLSAYYCWRMYIKRSRQIHFASAVVTVVSRQSSMSSSASLSVCDLPSDSF